MTAIGSILQRLPSTSAGLTPAAPPLMEPEEFNRLLGEVVSERAGLGWRLAGDLPAALSARLQRGEVRRSESPLVEALSRLPGEEADAFAGRVAGPPGRTPSERLLQSAAWSRVLAELVVEDGGKPCGIGVLDGPRAWTLENPAGRPLVDIAMEIGEALSRRRFVRIAPGMRLDVPAVVTLDRRSIREARHAHRAGGLAGPWLGMCIGNRTAHAPPLELVVASRLHMSVDELAAFMRRAHVAADRLLAGQHEDDPRAVARDLTRAHGDLWRPRRSWRTPPRSHGREEYVARTFSPQSGDGPLPTDLASLAWSVGVALDAQLRLHGWSGPLSPPFRVLCRTGGGEGGRRAILMAVRLEGGRPEPLSTFRARLESLRSREADGYGLLSEWQRLVARQPANGGLTSGLDLLGKMPGPVSALAGVAEIGWGELPTRRDAQWPVYSGSTPPTTASIAGRAGGVAVHANRIGDEVHVVVTARGTVAQRESAPAFVEAIIGAMRSA